MRIRNLFYLAALMVMSVVSNAVKKVLVWLVKQHPNYTKATQDTCTTKDAKPNPAVAREKEIAIHRRRQLRLSVNALELAIRRQSCDCGMVNAGGLKPVLAVTQSSLARLESEMNNTYGDSV